LSNVRVTYSGLIGLVVSIIGVITGTIFVIMVTRKLSPEELGLWTLINSLVAYVFVVDPIVSYWSTRQAARGEDIGKTALSVAALFSIGGILVYLIVSIFVSESLSIDFSLLLLSAILVPLLFLHGALSGIAFGTKPHSEQYAFVAFESAKIPLGFLFVVFYQMGLYGAILAIIFSNVIRIIILFTQLRSHIFGQIKLQLIKFWFKMSWLPMYAMIPSFAITLDVIIFSTISNSLTGLAFWTAGLTIAALVTQSGNISQALYPKLIATQKKEFAEVNLQRTLFFAIPFLALSVIFAKPILHIINPIYVGGIIIVYFLATRAFVNIFINFSYNVIKAYEQIDKNPNSSFGEYLKSKLFVIPTLTYIMSGIYLGSLIPLLLLKPSDWTDVYLVQMWSLVYFASHIPFAVYGIFSIKRNYGINLPWIHITKFSIVTLLASLVLNYLIEHYLEYKTSIWEFLPEVIPFVALGGLIYFGITYLIDNSTRTFFKSIFSEIIKK